MSFILISHHWKTKRYLIYLYNLQQYYFFDNKNDKTNSHGRYVLFQCTKTHIFLVVYPIFKLVKETTILINEF